MEIEELVKLALVNHDIDEEKIMNNVLKKGRRQVAVKRVIISIGISVLLAIPILALSFGLAKDDAPLPPEASVVTRYDILDTHPQTDAISTDTEQKRKIVVCREEDQYFKYSGDHLSEKLSKAFEKYDEDTEFFITAEFVPRNINDFLYKRKKIKEWINEADDARQEYIDIHNGDKDGDEYEALRIKEKAETELEKALENYKKEVFSNAVKYLNDKGIETISGTNNDNKLDIIASKNKVLEIISENSKESNITFRFMLGYNTWEINNADIIYE